MEWHALLFADKASYETWQKNVGTPIAEAVAADLKLSVIADEVVRITPNFPRQYLLFPCYEEETEHLRADVMRELYENPVLAETLAAFTAELQRLGTRRAATFEMTNPDARNSYFLTAVRDYCACVRRLAALAENVRSRGLALLHELAVSLCDAEFEEMERAVETLDAEGSALRTLSLTFDFDYKTVGVETLPDRPEGVADRLETLAREAFGTELRFDYSVVNANAISVLEEKLISLMKMRDPSSFAHMAAFYKRWHTLRFFRLLDLRAPLLFYVGYLAFVRRYEKKGFRFAWRRHDEAFDCGALYDLSLAVKLGDAKDIVPNDLYLEKGEIFVLSGANQGGKTTFLRAFGQCIALSAAGCPVPASSFSAPHIGFFATHFNRAEKTGRSRLEEELERIRLILPHLDGNSTVLFNECFVGTRRADAVELALDVLERLRTCGASGGFVTHYFELSQRDPRLVSLVAEVAADGSEKRCYRITKRPPDGLAHAESIARACGVTYEKLSELLAAEERSAK